MADYAKFLDMADKAVMEDAISEATRIFKKLHSLNVTVKRKGVGFILFVNGSIPIYEEALDVATLEVEFSCTLKKDKPDGKAHLILYQTVYETPMRPPYDHRKAVFVDKDEQFFDITRFGSTQVGIMLLEAAKNMVSFVKADYSKGTNFRLARRQR